MSEHRTRLLVAGVGPLPPERPDRLHAPGLRTWGMARELARAGHPVRLLTVSFGQNPPVLRRFDLVPGDPVAFPAGLLRESTDVPGSGGLSSLIKIEAREWGADAALGTTDLMNAALAAAGLDLPIWMDWFGDPMAERQLIAKAAGDDAPLDDQWALFAPALARADRLSGCATDQCAALLGELAAVGRLGRLTAGERLVYRIPPWLEPVGDAPGGDAEPFVRGAAVPSNAFLIVQTGGFNTWLDVATLFSAIEKAMASDERVHFAASGGGIPGHHTAGYGSFEQQVRSSPHKDRFHLLGWLPLADVPRLLAEADLAINLDLPCAEGILGTRNRLLDWLAAGIPILSTPGCDLASELGDLGFLTIIPHEDAGGAARAILAVAADPEPRRATARRGALWLARERTAAICLRPLLEWAADPKPAPDLQEWRMGSAVPPRLWRQASQTPENLAEQRRQLQRSAWLEEKLARLEGSRWVRLALKLRGRRGLEPPTKH